MDNDSHPKPFPLVLAWLNSEAICVPSRAKKFCSTPKRLGWITLTLGMFLLTLTGCQSLLIYEEDSGGLIAGKVATRTLLGISTIGFSEMVSIRSGRVPTTLSDSW